MLQVWVSLIVTIRATAEKDRMLRKKIYLCERLQISSECRTLLGRRRQCLRSKAEPHTQVGRLAAHLAATQNSFVRSISGKSRSRRLLCPASRPAFELQVI